MSPRPSGRANLTRRTRSSRRPRPDRSGVLAIFGGLLLVALIGGYAALTRPSLSGPAVDVAGASASGGASAGIPGPAAGGSPTGVGPLSSVGRASAPLVAEDEAHNQDADGDAELEARTSSTQLPPVPPLVSRDAAVWRASPSASGGEPLVESPLEPAADLVPPTSRGSGSAKGEPAAPPGENAYFTLVLSGALDGKQLDPNDSQTWARLAYALREEATAPYILVYPGGGTPLVMPPPGSALARRKPREVKVPPGDPATPTYRIVLDAKVSAEGGISFYGRKMASRYGARLSASIEKRSGDRFVPVKTISHSEGHTTSVADREDPETIVRKLYDVALDTLAGKILQTPLFRSRSVKLDVDSLRSSATK